MSIKKGLHCALRLSTGCKNSSAPNLHSEVDGLHSMRDADSAGRGSDLSVDDPCRQAGRQLTTDPVHRDAAVRPTPLHSQYSHSASCGSKGVSCKSNYSQNSHFAFCGKAITVRTATLLTVAAKAFHEMQSQSE